MREFTFSITYGPGAAPLMDEFVDRPGLAANSMDVPLAPDAFCRIERFAGPRPALDAVERLRTGPSTAGESVGETPLDALLPAQAGFGPPRRLVRRNGSIGPVHPALSRERRRRAPRLDSRSREPGVSGRAPTGLSVAVCRARALRG